MQAVDNRESRLRIAFSKIETEDGRIRKEDLIRLLTVRFQFKILNCLKLVNFTFQRPKDP